MIPDSGLQCTFTAFTECSFAEITAERPRKPAYRIKTIRYCRASHEH